MPRRVKVPTHSSRVRNKNFKKAGKNDGLKVTSNAGTQNKHLKVTSSNAFVGSIS